MALWETVPSAARNWVGFMTKGKLIYILNHYAENAASHFYHILDLLKEMAENGIEIAVVIEKCDSIPNISGYPHITVYPQKSKWKWMRPFELMHILYKLHRKKYEHIFIRISWVAAVVAILVSWFTKQKTWYWLSGQGSFEHYASLKPGLGKWRLFLSSKLPFIFIKNQVYRFVTGPETLGDYMEKQGHVNKRKLVLLYNDVLVSRFEPISREEKEIARQKMRIPQNAMVVLFVHRFSPLRKSTYYLPYLFQHIHPSASGNSETSVVFLMAGSGPEWEEVKNATAALPISHDIRWLGDIPNKQIQTYYQIADLFINPTWAEGFPRVILEAMASGIPIVTTDAGGIRDIMGKEQSDFIVQKEDRDAFSEKCNQLLENPALRNELSLENRKVVTRFDTPVVARMYINTLFHA